MKRGILRMVLALLFVGLLFGQKALLASLPESRVEVLTKDGREIVTEDVDLFTAQRLAAAQPEALVLDYSWATAVLKASGALWQLAAAIAALCMLLLVLVRQFRLETARAKEAMKTVYGSAYWEEAGVRILAKSAAAAAGLFVGILLVRWLIDHPIVLPPTLLPQEDLLDSAHYRQWFAAAFPQGQCSDYALALLSQWKTSALLVSAQTLTLLLLAITAGGKTGEICGKICRQAEEKERS